MIKEYLETVKALELPFDQILLALAILKPGCLFSFDIIPATGGSLHLNFKLLEDLLPTEYMGKPAPKGYFWKVVVDPTRNGEEPGCFYGSLFRLLDIVIFISHRYKNLL